MVKYTASYDYVYDLLQLLYTVNYDIFDFREGFIFMKLRIYGMRSFAKMFRKKKHREKVISLCRLLMKVNQAQVAFLTAANLTFYEVQNLHVQY